MTAFTLEKECCYIPMTFTTPLYYILPSHKSSIQRYEINGNFLPYNPKEGEHPEDDELLKLQQTKNWVIFFAMEHLAFGRDRDIAVIWVYDIESDIIYCKDNLVKLFEDEHINLPLDMRLLDATEKLPNEHDVYQVLAYDSEDDEFYDITDEYDMEIELNWQLDQYIDGIAQPIVLQSSISHIPQVIKPKI